MELREGQICQGRAVDKGQGTSDKGQVGCGDGGEGGGEETQIARDVVEIVEADGLDVPERCIVDCLEFGKADGELGRIGGDGEGTADCLQGGLLNRLQETIVV